MYPVPDDDLELLESYLDDALSEPEVEALRHRLAHEPQLAAALKQLRDERADRQAFFQSIDPAPAEVDRLVGSIQDATRRHGRRQGRMRLLRAGSAIAASAAVGLLVGLLYKINVGGGTRMVDGAATSVKVAAPGGAGSPGTVGQKFAVEVTDDAGRVIAVQQFDNASEAHDFAGDLRKMQNERRRARNGVITVGDEF